MTTIEGLLKKNTSGEFELQGQELTRGSALHVKLGQKWIQGQVDRLEGQYVLVREGRLVTLREGDQARVIQ